MRQQRRSVTMAATLAVTALLLGGSSAVSATVFEVGVNGTLQQILTGTLADGDVIHVPADAGVAADMTQSVTITKAIAITGDGPGFSVIRNAAINKIPFVTVQSSVRLSGVTLEGFSDAVTLTPAPSTAIRFEARAVEVKDGDRGIVATQEQGATDRLAHVVIEDCRFRDLDNAAIFLLTRNIDGVEVAGNHIETVGLVGIWVGREGNADDLEAFASDIQIHDNHISGVEERRFGSFDRYFGIAVFGRETLIHGNVIRDLQEIDLTKPAGGGDSYVAIYTKAAYSVIQANKLICPPGYCIDLKGLSRGADPVESPSYSGIVANNQLFIADPTGKRYSGIKTNVEDVTIIGNHIEGASQEGILVQAAAPDDVSVIGNTVILGSFNLGLGYGLNVQTNSLTVPNPATRRIMAVNNRFVGIAAGADVVNRVYNGSIWQPLPLPTAPGEWVVTNNIRH